MVWYGIAFNHPNDRVLILCRTGGGNVRKINMMALKKRTKKVASPITDTKWNTKQQHQQVTPSTIVYHGHAFDDDTKRASIAAVVNGSASISHGRSRLKRPSSASASTVRSSQRSRSVTGRPPTIATPTTVAVIPPSIESFMNGSSPPSTNTRQPRRSLSSKGTLTSARKATSAARRGSSTTIARARNRAISNVNNSNIAAASAGGGGRMALMDSATPRANEFAAALDALRPRTQSAQARLDQIQRAARQQLADDIAARTAAPPVMTSRVGLLSPSTFGLEPHPLSTLPLSHIANLPTEELLRLTAPGGASQVTSRPQPLWPPQSQQPQMRPHHQPTIAWQANDSSAQSRPKGRPTAASIAAVEERPRNIDASRERQIATIDHTNDRARRGSSRGAYDHQRYSPVRPRQKPRVDTSTSQLVAQLKFPPDLLRMLYVTSLPIPLSTLHVRFDLGMIAAGCVE
jgi:hypothetical protein